MDFCQFCVGPKKKSFGVEGVLQFLNCFSASPADFTVLSITG